ncbi:hypothetical protein [Providencia huaxiensis]|uniref:hypothetical protein n=1 Tax=Providencia huaxiensis TaxID=2027290 RepID=UPI001E086FB0
MKKLLWQMTSLFSMCGSLTAYAVPVVGTIAGAAVGALFGRLVAGATAGAVSGSALDGVVFDRYECIECEYTFD